MLPLFLFVVLISWTRGTWCISLSINILNICRQYFFYHDLESSLSYNEISIIHTHFFFLGKLSLLVLSLHVFNCKIAGFTHLESTVCVKICVFLKTHLHTWICKYINVNVIIRGLFNLSVLDQIPYIESGVYVAYNNESGGVIQHLKEDGILNLDTEFCSIPEWISMEAMISSWLVDAITYELWLGSDGSSAFKIYYSDLPWLIGKVLFAKQEYTVKQRLGITKENAEPREKEVVLYHRSPFCFCKFLICPNTHVHIHICAYFIMFISSIMLKIMHLDWKMIVLKSSIICSSFFYFILFFSCLKLYMLICIGYVQIYKRAKIAYGALSTRLGEQEFLFEDRWLLAFLLMLSFRF